jgi:hypothetical protein
MVPRRPEKTKETMWPQDRLTDSLQCNVLHVLPCIKIYRALSTPNQPLTPELPLLERVWYHQHRLT